MKVCLDSRKLFGPSTSTATAASTLAGEGSSWLGDVLTKRNITTVRKTVNAARKKNLIRLITFLFIILKNGHVAYTTLNETGHLAIGWQIMCSKLTSCVIKFGLSAVIYGIETDGELLRYEYTWGSHGCHASTEDRSLEIEVHFSRRVAFSTRLNCIFSSTEFIDTRRRTHSTI